MPTQWTIQNPEKEEDQLDRALREIRSAMLDGLNHGFFEFEISGEVLKGGKRAVLFKAGRIHRYVIPEAEIQFPTNQWRRPETGAPTAGQEGLHADRGERDRRADGESPGKTLAPTLPKGDDDQYG